ncbi:MAG: hypothetical protein ABL876_07885 [Chitinophagaceae bacterium]
MKNMTSKNPKHNTQFNTHKHIPENKDNLDSRENEEQLNKGDNTTHNHKEQKSSKKKGAKK